MIPSNFPPQGVGNWKVMGLCLRRTGVVSLDRYRKETKILICVFIIEEKLHFHKQERFLVYLEFHCLKIAKIVRRHA